MGFSEIKKYVWNGNKPETSSNVRDHVYESLKLFAPHVLTDSTWDRWWPLPFPLIVFFPD